MKKIIVLLFLLFSLKSFSQTQHPDVTLDEGKIAVTIANNKEMLSKLKEEICARVNEITQDVTKMSDGTLAYPNWVRFEQIARDLADLNDKWNDAYGDALNAIIDDAIKAGATNVTVNDEEGKDLLSDLIEESVLLFEDDIASVCFEKKFDFTSLRNCLEDKEKGWLESLLEGNENINFSEAPTLTEEIDDDIYWPLLTCEKKYTVLDTKVTDEMLQTLSDEEKKDILASIKDVVGVLSGVVDFLDKLYNLFADCAGSNNAHLRDVRDGFQMVNQPKWIGYSIKQHGVALDVKKTVTRIKGKAKLWKNNKKGKKKKDRRTKIGISFCAREWNGCDKQDWPQDGIYKHPRAEHRKKVRTIRFLHPMALQINKTYHFLEFKFGVEGIFEKGINLLGNDECVPSSNTDW